MTTFRHSLQRTALLLLCPFVFLYLKRKKNIAIGAVLTVASCIMGCFQHYYTKDIRYTTDPALIERLRVSNKLFIAHFQDSLVLLNNLRAEKDQFFAEARRVDQDMRHQVDPEQMHKRTYRPSTEGTVPMQVHFYLKEPIAAYRTNDSVTCRLRYSDIQKTDIYDKDEDATNTSTVLSIVGTAVGVVLVGMIILAIACNCPQVYVDETNGYAFKGGLYSGAVMSSAERTDYMVLDNFPSNRRTARIRIDNVKGETQHINQLRLLRVRHPKGSRVLADRHGKLYSYSEPVGPLAAWSGSGRDIHANIQSADGRMAFFDERDERKSSTLMLRFPVKNSGKKARLILHGYNTGWAGYLNQQFQGYFGRYYTDWRNQQENKDPKKMEQWLLKQSLPIKVYTRQVDGSWKMADYIPLAGNTAMRKWILELELPSATSSTVDIKLETVYNFWQIDYAALDFSEQSAVQTKWLVPEVIQTGNPTAREIELAGIDRKYLVLQGDESLTVEFMLPADNTDQETYFLAGTGYYHQPPVTEGHPDIRKLIAFRKPGAFQSLSVNETRKMESNTVALHERQARKR